MESLNSELGLVYNKEIAVKLITDQIRSHQVQSCYHLIPCIHDELILRIVIIGPCTIHNVEITFVYSWPLIPFLFQPRTFLEDFSLGKCYVY